MNEKEKLVQLALQLMDEYQPLPVTSSGQVSIQEKVHPAGQKLGIVSFREAIFSGLPTAEVYLQKPYIEQQLVDAENGTWMTNRPCELVQMHRDFARSASGRVLIGGLGLGIASAMCEKRKPKVKTVVTVEQSSDVIALAGERASAIVHDDLFRFVGNLKPKEFDCALFDIWQGTGEWIWQTQVVPLRRLAYRKIKRINCWQEATMQGQVVSGLWKAADFPAERLLSCSHCHWYAFRKAAVALGVRPQTPRISDPKEFEELFRFEQENQQDQRLRALASILIHRVGSPEWERLFGEPWDEAIGTERVA